jgi:hypothetical protein
VLSTRHDAFAKGELATSRLADLFGELVRFALSPIESRKLKPLVMFGIKYRRWVSHSQISLKQFEEHKPRIVAIVSRIILTNGNTWKVQRSAGHAAFANPINLRYFLDRILPKHLDKLFGGLDKAAEAEGQGGEVVDLQEVAYDYAMSVFGELAYDVSSMVAEMRSTMLIQELSARW